MQGVYLEHTQLSSARKKETLDICKYSCLLQVILSVMLHLEWLELEGNRIVQLKEIYKDQVQLSDFFSADQN